MIGTVICSTATALTQPLSLPPTKPGRKQRALLRIGPGSSSSRRGWGAQPWGMQLVVRIPDRAVAIQPFQRDPARSNVVRVNDRKTLGMELLKSQLHRVGPNYSAAGFFSLPRRKLLDLAGTIQHDPGRPIRGNAARPGATGRKSYARVQEPTAYHGRGGVGPQMLCFYDTRTSSRMERADQVSHAG